MPLWFGETWTCFCGWLNAVLRRTCRNCGRLRDKAEQLKAAHEEMSAEGAD